MRRPLGINAFSLDWANLADGGPAEPSVTAADTACAENVVVHDAQGRSVVDAVVQATALRGDARPTVPRPTDADGAARLRVTPTRRLRLAGGSRLILVIRVRRPTDGWAAAASGSRLVSVRTSKP